MRHVAAKPRLLITGASGFLGAATAAAAHLNGYDVLGTGRTPDAPRAKAAGFAYQPLDLSDAAATDAVLQAFRPQVIVHAAWSGVSGQARDQDVQYDNVLATCRLMDLGAAYGLEKFIGIGSQAEYGPFEGRIDESRMPSPATLYGAAKHAACTLARQRALAHNVQFAWLRLFAIYGPGDNSNWLIPSLISAMLDDRCPPMTEGIQKWDYLFIEDAAQALLSLIDAMGVNEDATGVFNFCSGQAVRVRSIAEEIARLTAPDLPLHFGTIAYKAGQIFHMEGDPTKLQSATGWHPTTSLEAGLAATVRHMRAMA
jgi:nucleoside-diphosphate-sugar epimerase